MGSSSRQRALTTSRFGQTSLKTLRWCNSTTAFWAISLLLVTLYLWYSSRGSAIVATRRAFVCVLAAVLAQMVLGIITVLNAAPWQWAILHQLGAIIVIVSVLNARFLALYSKAQTLR